MQLIRVPVIKAFTHHGRALKAGQSIELSPVQAAVLARQGVVSLTRDVARRRARRREVVEP